MSKIVALLAVFLFAVAMVAPALGAAPIPDQKPAEQYYAAYGYPSYHGGYAGYAYPGVYGAYYYR